MRLRIWARIAAAAAALLLIGGLAPGGYFETPALAAQPADVDDFTFDSFDGEYELSRDAEGRSSLRTKETIVARFPDFDQNRGFIRELVRNYDGHDTDLQVLSVTDEHGTPRDYSTQERGDYLDLTIAVPEGSFVHGVQTYVIEYTQRDVTRYFEDTDEDEFYWDVNGTGWAQPFGRVSARVEVDPNLDDSLSGASACYVGSLGSNEPCDRRGQQGDEEQGVFEASADSLRPGENLTIAIGFERGTFAPPPAPFLERFPLLIWGGIASLLAAVVTFVVGAVTGRGARTNRPIIAQYEPPAGVSAATSAELLRERKRGMTATLLDFAVRRRVRLLRDEAKDRYGLEALSADGLDPAERWLYGRLFDSRRDGTDVEPGTRIWLKKSDTKLGDAASMLGDRVKREVKKQEYLKPASRLIIGVVAVLLFVALALLIAHAIAVGDRVLTIVLLTAGVGVLICGVIAVTWALASRHRPTLKGAEVLDHLEGLREYIRLAEADRLRVLQSTTGAEVDEELIVGVYERLLPYAVLFGFEQEWQAELAKYYRESTPDWLQGSGSADTSFVHTLSIANFTRTVAASPVTKGSYTGGAGTGSGASFSSFSGGASGGGFSGGGGGGGGGRGI